MAHGTEPAELDHINLNKADNRLVNLRASTHSENIINTAIRADNKSGYRGVSYHGPSGKWRARITRNNRTISLGLHPTAKDAHCAFVKANGMQEAGLI
jgi:hypothetical protein